MSQAPQRIHPKLFQLAQLGGRDRSRQLEASGAWLASHTPAGPGTIHLRCQHGAWRHRAWGPGADYLCHLATSLTGTSDTLEGFEPSSHPSLAALWRKHRTLRLTASPSVFTSLVQIVLQQRVSWRDAVRSHNLMDRAFGAPAPGPCDLRLPPRPDQLRATPTHAFHAFGVERKRAETLRRIASLGHRLECLRTEGETSPPLRSIRGIGPWSEAMLRGTALADADALPLGDYALPHTVAWFFRNKARSTDEEMAEILEPFRPHRYRVIRLLWAAGITAPRFGPRRPLRPIPAALSYFCYTSPRL